VLGIQALLILSVSDEVLLLCYLQFVRVQEHDRVSPVYNLLAAVSIWFPVRAICLFRRYWSCAEQALRKHILIADDGGPRRVALKSSNIVIPGLSIQLCDFGHRLLLV